MKWINCEECSEEFRVISESLESVAYCPFCGNELADETEFDEENDDYED